MHEVLACDVAKINREECKNDEGGMAQLNCMQNNEMKFLMHSCNI